MKKFLKVLRIIVTAVFLAAVFILIFCRITYVFRDKSLESEQDNFAALPGDSVDVVFIGSSHVFCSTDPRILRDEYGISAFDLATSAQTIPMSYYAAMEAIELQHPKAIVLELLNCTNVAYTVKDEYTHSFFDAMPMCRAKYEGINDLADAGGRIYYFLPIGFYHTRWKSLTESDYASVINGNYGYFPHSEAEDIGKIPIYPDDDTLPVDERMMEYLEKTVNLCKDSNVKLYFYTTPFNAQDDGAYEQMVLKNKEENFNWLEIYARENDIPYLNLFHYIAETGLDTESDYFDHTHTNDSGAAKITRYLAENLISEYSVNAG